MKKLLLLATLFIVVSVNAQEQPKKNEATVSQYGGVYVFLYSEPKREYEFVANIRKTFVANSMSDAINKYANFAKKEYQNADGIIIRSVPLGFEKDNFDVIKFKE